MRKSEYEEVKKILFNNPTLTTADVDRMLDKEPGYTEGLLDEEDLYNYAIALEKEPNLRESTFRRLATLFPGLTYSRIDEVLNKPRGWAKDLREQT